MAEEAPGNGPNLFEFELQDDILVVVPQTDLHELDYQRIEAGAKGILDLLYSILIRHVVLDFHMTDTYGSTALGFFVKLLKRVRSRNGHMAFCNVSAHEKEILQITGLHHSWPICASRAEAMEAVRK